MKIPNSNNSYRFIDKCGDTIEKQREFFNILRHIKYQQTIDDRYPLNYTLSVMLYNIFPGVNEKKTCEMNVKEFRAREKYLHVVSDINGMYSWFIQPYYGTDMINRSLYYFNNRDEEDQRVIGMMSFYPKFWERNLKKWKKRIEMVHVEMWSRYNKI